MMKDWTFKKLHSVCHALFTASYICMTGGAIALIRDERDIGALLIVASLGVYFLRIMVMPYYERKYTELVKALMEGES